MEKVVAIKLEVDGGQSVAEVSELERGLQEVNTSLKDISTSAKKTESATEQSLKKLNQQIENGELNYQQLTKAVKDYQSIAISAGRDSAIGQEAIQRAAQLKDQLVDLDNEVKRVAHDGANMQAAMQLGQGVIAGYTAFQGVTAMLGVENEELMKTMVKLQGAQSALMGVEQIRASLEKESFLIQKAKIVQTKALAGAQLVYATAVGTSTGALKLFRIALLATGIGALIVALGLVVANFDKIKKALQNFDQIIYDSFIPAVDGMKKVLNLFLSEQNRYKLSSEQTAKVVVENIDKEIEANNKRRKDLDKTIEANKKLVDETQLQLEREIDLRRANGEDVRYLEIDKQELFIESLKVEQDLFKEKLKLIKEEFEARARVNQLTLTQMIELSNQFAESLQNVKDISSGIVSAEHDLAVRRAEIRKENRDNAVKGNEEEIAILDRHLEDVKVKLEDAMETMPSLIAIPEGEIDTYFSGLLGRLNEFYDDWKRLDKEAKLDMAEVALDYSNSLLSSISSVADATNQGAEMEVATIEKKTAEKLKNEQLSAQQKYQIELASALATDKINKEVFERNKKLQMAQASIDGATAVVKALSSAPPPFNFILAGAVGAAALLQLNAIRKTQYQSQATSISPPSFNVPSDNQTDTTTNGDTVPFSGSQTYLNTNPVVSVLEINATQKRLDDINSVGIIGG